MRRSVCRAACPETVGEPQPASTRRLATALAVTFGATLFVLTEFVFLDWLWSRADPYPYAAALATTVACAAGLASTGTRPGIIAARAIYGLALAATAAAATSWSGNAIFAAAAVLAMLGVVVLAQGTARSLRKSLAGARMTASLLVLAGIGYLACAALSGPVKWAVAGGQWLGNGLGTSADSSYSAPMDVLAAEWGGCLVAALLALVIVAICLAAGVMVATIRGKVRREHAIAAALGSAILAGLFVQARTAPAFLTTTTIPGTWALMVAISAIDIAARPAAKRGHPGEAATKRWNRRRLGAWAAVLGVVLAAILVAHMVLLARVPPYARSGAPSGYARFVPLSGISQAMQDATVAMEDGHFYLEGAFDFVAMHRALRTDIREGRIEQGGSTITQQLAKNLFCSDDRTIWRKIVEAAYAMEMNRDLSKSRILELYLNTIDYGYGMHGVSAAAAYYFHETPAQLDVAQSAILVGLVPSPPRARPEPSGEPQYEDLGKLEEGKQTALGRMEFFFPSRYPQAVTDPALNVPLDRLIYPYKDAWDRGATDVIPAEMDGVSFYYYADPDEPADINQAAYCLKQRLATFVRQAHAWFDLVGIDHLGVYDDRGMRQDGQALSAHAYGQAIDISGFRFADGSRIKVADHGRPAVARRLAPIEALLKKDFDIVIDWRDDPKYHQTHFHCEVRGPRPTAPRSAYASILTDSADGDSQVIRGGAGPFPDVRHVVFESLFMGGRPEGFNIFLPPGYADRPARRFPVVYFCHGYEDDENTWVRRGLAVWLERAMAGGQSPPEIFVFLNGDGTSGYNDLGPGKMVESYIIRELIPYVDTHYRTIPNRTGRAIEGFSMGGYGALKLAYKYPNLFSSVVSYAAATQFADGPRDDISVLAREHASVLRRELSIRLSGGEEDGLTEAAVIPHHELLDRLHIPNTFEEVPGVGHSLNDLYDGDDGLVGLRGLRFHAAAFARAAQRAQGMGFP